MENILLIGMLCWVATVCAVWIIIRNKKPGWVGIGPDRNKQKIDGVKYNICPSCQKGALDPIFKWWQYCLSLTLPPGFIYVWGAPEFYVCNVCNKVENNPERDKKFTRISLTHKLDKSYFIAMGFNICLMLVVVMILKTLNII